MKTDDNKNTEILAGGKGFHFALAVANFNAPITDSLFSACRLTLMAAGAPAPTVLRVPGAFELPFACRMLAKTGKYHAVIALGCVIRGETPHDRYICQAVSQGIMNVGLDTGIPVIFGVLTTMNEDQAWDRAGKSRHNKGREAAQAALRMAALLKGKK